MIVRAKPIVDPKYLCDLINGKIDNTDNKESSLLFFNSGVAALTFFLKNFGVGKKVGIQVFTCPTVLDAIYAANDIPVFIDINIDYYTTTAVEIMNNDNIKDIDILICSHLFGIPNPDYIEIKNWCKTNKIVLIDDLCQTYMSKIGDVFLEDLCDNYFYSFYIDKPVSGMSGGALKVSSSLLSSFKNKFIELPIESNKHGLFLLKKLYLLNQLLSPEIYKEEFRYNTFVEDILYRYYPMKKNVVLLYKLFKLLRPINILISRYIPTNNHSKIKRMSNIQKKFILHQMGLYNDNNIVFRDFLRKYDIKCAYFNNINITCSIAKRATISRENINTIQKKLFLNGIQSGLHNWPSLVDNVNVYKKASMVIKNTINIPTWNNNIYN